MLQEDSIAERRRLKKQKDGEEDPISVAQRFLNLYRQLHIFSPEKKAIFDKKLLELPVEIKNAFGTLPGGGMVQDYIYDLEEKLGIEEDVPEPSSAPKSNILEAALADSSDDEAPKEAPAFATPQASVLQQATPPKVETIRVAAAPSSIELGKNFAQDMAQALSAALKSMPQKEVVQVQGPAFNSKEFASEMAAALSGIVNSSNNASGATPSPAMSPVFDAKEFAAELSKVLAEVVKTASPAATNTQELKDILNVMDKNYTQMLQMLKEDNVQSRSEMQNLTQMVVRGQMHLAKALAGSNFESSEEKREPLDTQTLKSIDTTQQLMVKALVGLTQIQKKDSEQMAQALAKSQQEMAKILTQNNFAANAANQNANNIQINTPDNSAQLTLIVDKLATLQAQNSQAFEKMMEKLVTTQSDLYRNIAEHQTKEISAIITLALKESQKISTQNIIDALKNLPKAQIIAPSEAVFSPSRPLQDLPQDQEPIPSFSEDEVPVQNIKAESDTLIEEQPSSLYDKEPINDISATQPVESNFTSEEEALPKKKKKKKKKNKNKNNDLLLAEEPKPSSDDAFLPVTAQNDDDFAVLENSPSSFEDLPFSNNELSEKNASENIVSSFSADDEVAEQNVKEKTTTEDNVSSPKRKKHIWDRDFAEDIATQKDDSVSEEEPVALSSPEDWGWSETSDLTNESLVDSEPEKNNPPLSLEENSTTDNDEGIEGQDWEWSYEYEEPEGADNPPLNDTNFSSENLTRIGNYSLLCSGDLSTQKKIFQKGKKKPIDYKLFDISSKIKIKDLAKTQQEDDPYKNSDSKD